MTLLERPKASDGIAAQDARAIRRARRGSVERGDHVLSRGPSLQLRHHVVRDFLRRNKFHLAERGDGLEFVAGEESVLPDVDVDAVQRLPELAPVPSTSLEGILDWHGRVAIDE